MAGLQFDSGLDTSLFGEIADLDAVWDNGALTLAVTGRFGVELWRITYTEQTLRTTVGIVAAPGIRPDTDLDIEDGTAHLLISGDFFGGSSAVDIVLAGGPDVTTTLGGPAQHPAALRLEIGGSTFYINALAGVAGVELWSVAPDGTLTAMSGLDADAMATVGAVTKLEPLSLDGRDYVLALSATSGRLSLIEVLADGTMDLAAALGSGDGIPVDGAVSMVVTQVGAKQFAIVGSAPTSSLAVFEIGAAGTLSLTDYVIDTLNTRFDAAPALAALSGEDVAHVIAGGADDGLSVMVLTDEGQLIHVETIADTEDTALDGVSALEVVRTGDDIVVVAADQTGGVSLFDLDPAGADGVAEAEGDGTPLNGGIGEEILFGSDAGEAIDGGSGDDILADGAGADTLTGGAGADHFVFVEDGETDRITDFDPDVDLLDFSAATESLDPDAIGLSGDGAEMTLVIEGETLILSAAPGVELTEGAVRASVVLSFDRPTLPQTARNLTGSEGADTLLGAEFSDTIDGAGGNDLIAGEAGADILEGGTGNDVLLGDGIDELTTPILFDPGFSDDFF